MVIKLSEAEARVSSRANLVNQIDIRGSASISREESSLARSAALDKLMLSLNLISEDNLKEESVRSLAKIAKDLSFAARNIVNESAPRNALQINMYGPRQRTEEDYESVEVVK